MHAKAVFLPFSTFEGIPDIGGKVTKVQLLKVNRSCQTDVELSSILSTFSFNGHVVLVLEGYD